MLWIPEFWLRKSRRVDTTMEQVVTNLQQQLSSQQQALQQVQGVMDAQQASAAQGENALQAQLADLSDRLNLNMAEAGLVSGT